MENSEFRVVRRNLLERIFGEDGKIRDIHELELFLRALTSPSHISQFLELALREYNIGRTIYSKYRKMGGNFIDEFWLKTDNKRSFMLPLRLGNKPDMVASIKPAEGNYLRLTSPILATNEFSTLLVFGYGQPSADTMDGNLYRVVLMGDNKEPSKFYLATSFFKCPDGIKVSHRTNSEDYAMRHPNLCFEVK